MSSVEAEPARWCRPPRGGPRPARAPRRPSPSPSPPDRPLEGLGRRDVEHDRHDVGIGRRAAGRPRSRRDRPPDWAAPWRICWVTTSGGGLAVSVVMSLMRGARARCSSQLTGAQAARHTDRQRQQRPRRSRAGGRPAASARRSRAPARSRPRRHRSRNGTRRSHDVEVDAEKAMQRAADRDGQRRRARQQESKARETMADRVGRANETCPPLSCHGNRTYRQTRPGCLCGAYDNRSTAERAPGDGGGLRRHRAVGRAGHPLGPGRADPALPDGCHDVHHRRRDRHRARARARPRLERPGALAGARSGCSASAACSATTRSTSPPCSSRRRPRPTSSTISGRC